MFNNIPYFWIYTMAKVDLKNKWKMVANTFLKPHIKTYPTFLSGSSVVSEENTLVWPWKNLFGWSSNAISPMTKKADQGRYVSSNMFIMFSIAKVKLFIATNL